MAAGWWCIRGKSGPLVARCAGNRRDQRLDVSKRESEALVTIRVALDLRNVIRHHHPVKSDLLINAHRLQHINIAVVDERFLEVEKTSTDVSEMNVEDLLPAAEVADHIEDFLPGLL